MAAAQTDSARLAEMLAVLRRHQPGRGMSPEKLLAILEELGPTYVKLGQILSQRGDLLPAEYCEALSRLRTDVPPMPIETVRDILSTELGCEWTEVFSALSEQPLGSASIAQVHEAWLRDGRHAAVKVQRPGLWEVMERDIRLLKRAAGLLRRSPAGEAVDFQDVLEHLWTAARQEMDFLQEESNLREFKADCAELRYADCPGTVPELCTRNVLVMDYVGGCQVDDADALEAAGYDRGEIAVKLVYHYIEQITEYRFFHADPHPGNIRVEDGKIWWLDLGMMGRLTAREAALYTTVIHRISEGDSLGLTEALLELAAQGDAPDRDAISESVAAFFRKYQSMPMGEMNMGALVEEFLALLRRHGLQLPTGLTMLGRSLVVIQGSLVVLDPEVNVLEIVAQYMAQEELKRGLSQEGLKQLALELGRSGEKLGRLPMQLSAVLERMAAGELSVRARTRRSDGDAALLRELCCKLVLALLCVGLLIAASAGLTAPLPGLWGIPWPSVTMFVLATFTAIALTCRKR